MSRLGFFCILVCVALCTGQFRRPLNPRTRGLRGRGFRGRVIGGFAGADDCRQVFQTPTNDQFCSTYVNQCANMFDNPQPAQGRQCASCIFVWMTQCPQNNSG